MSKGDEVELLKLLNEPLPTQVSPVEIEARLAIAAILTTGRKLEALMQLRVFPCDQSLRASGRCFGLIASRQKFRWILPLGSPQRAQLRTEEWTEAELYTRDPQAFPTFSWPASEWVRRFWRMKRATPRKSGTPLLEATGDDLVPKILELLRGRRSKFFAEPRHASRTLEALERYLCAALTHQPGGDLASAARITDNTSHLSETASHYGDTLVSDPEEDGDDTVAERQRLSIVGDIDVRGQRLGGAKTPSAISLKFIVAELQQEIETASPSSDRFHRAYSRYTAFLVCFGLAHRGEKDQPLPSSRAIDRETGFVAIHDTLRTDRETHTRLAWAPAMVRQQIDYYEDYLRRRQSDFPLALNAYVTRQLTDCALPFVEFDGGAWRPISTREIYEKIRAGSSLNSPLKLNAGRHWLRSQMLGRCSEETINAFLGHWYLGREPWTYGSTFDPFRYRADLEQCLPGLLRDLGFAPIPASGLTNDN